MVTTDATGTAALPNGAEGIRIIDGAQFNRIGTDGDGVADAAERNIISGNGNNGLSVESSDTMSNTISGNYIGIDESPKEIYGKVMSIPDKLIYPYFELISDVALSELSEIKTTLAKVDTNPRDVKKYLARTVVKMYQGEEASKDAESEFERIFVQKMNPDQMAQVLIEEKNCRIDELLIKTKTASSKNEARRLIQQGGVSVDGEKISDPFQSVSIEKEIILKVGKRKFAKVKSKN